MSSPSSAATSPSTGGNSGFQQPSVAPSTSRPETPPQRTVTVTGTTSGRTYTADVWGSDTVTDCAAHAYGAPIIRFLRAHPCNPTHRVLATVRLDGREVALSSISTSFHGTGPDAYGAAARFVKLELANGTGSLNDLLREGGHIPGVSGGIPAHEAFSVLAQDIGVDILDAWYVHGGTVDQDPRLVALEQDLFLTRLTTG